MLIHSPIVIADLDMVVDLLGKLAAVADNTAIEFNRDCLRESLEKRYRRGMHVGAKQEDFKNERNRNEESAERKA